MANNKPNSIWNDLKLLNALIEAVHSGPSFDRIAILLSKEFGVSVTPGCVSGKVGRLRKAGMVFPERISYIKNNTVAQEVKEAVRRDIKDGYSRSVIAERNGVSPKYVKGQREAIRNESDISDGRRQENKDRHKSFLQKEDELPERIPVAPVAIIIPFETPARRQPHSQRTCEFLTGNKKPWLRCDNPTAHHTSWCNEHGRKVFVVWPPKNYQHEDQKYG